MIASAVSLHLTSHANFHTYFKSIEDKKGGNWKFQQANERVALKRGKEVLNALIFSYIFTSFVLFNPLRDLQYTIESKAIASGVQVYS